MSGPLRRAIGFAIVPLLLVPAAAWGDGNSASRRFGPLEFTHTLDGTRAQASVVVTLEGEQVGSLVMTYGHHQADFNVAAGNASAQGRLSLSINAAPQPSAINGDFTYRTGADDPVPFRGTVVSWTAPDDLVLVDQRFALAADLEARTVVRNGARDGAEINLLSGSVLLYSAVLLPPSPVTRTTTALTVGPVHVVRGASMTLRPPGRLADGTVFLRCRFQTGSVPPTNFQGIVARWSPDTSAVALPADNDRQAPVGQARVAKARGEK